MTREQVLKNCNAFVQQYDKDIRVKCQLSLRQAEGLVNK